MVTARRSAAQPNPTRSSKGSAGTAKASAPSSVPAKPVLVAADGAQAGNAPKKPKLVRDGFTMPESDFALIAALKARAVKAGRETKKSEILRAGLQLLATQDDAGVMAALGRLQSIKTGRPRKGH